MENGGGGGFRERDGGGKAVVEGGGGFRERGGGGEVVVEGGGGAEVHDYVEVVFVVEYLETVNFVVS